jgi:hypothetical protein
MGLKSRWEKLLSKQEFKVPHVSSMLVEELGDGRDVLEQHILSRKKVTGGEEISLDNGLTYLISGEGEKRRMQLLDEKIMSFVRE